MWDLSSEVQWWEEWQLRILVLGSLFSQFVLFVGSMMRNVRLPSLFRSCMWLAYIGADALAVYALSTLFNRHKQPAGGALLEVLWAPVLLLHLGGQHTFTAYSIEDNELWGRQLVTLVSQVTVALYVFCKAWPGSGGDKRLLKAAILLFIVGILKFIQKPLALKAASFSSLMTSSAVYPQRRAQSALYMLLVPGISTLSIEDAVQLREEEEHDISIEEFVQKARELAFMTEVEPLQRSRYGWDKQFVDLSAPYSRRLRDLSSFLKLVLRDVDLELKTELSYSFEMIYTNFKTAFTVPGFLLKLLLPSMSLASTVLFAKSHKNGYKQNDIRITYILLWCTALLGFLPLLVCLCLFGGNIWSITAAQHNLVSFSARRSRPTKLMKVSAIVGCKDYINKHWYIEQEPAPGCLEVISLVLGQLKEGWRQYIVDGASYRRFNNLRGQWAMSRYQVRDPRLLWSLQVPFDQSVVVWHVATELCLHHPGTSSPAAAGAQESSARRCSKVISSYMIYLLLIRPEMLMPGTRQGLFSITSDDIEVMLEHADRPASSSLDGTSVAERILRVAKSPSPYANRIGASILKACSLAEDLMELLGEQERWMVIQGVWVEMLCYSASRCRGFLHAKSMGEGVEFLTFVWVLLSRMGMETLADKFQRPDTAEHAWEWRH